MSLFIDIKFLKLVSGRLPLFKDKGRNVYTCRCTICGDSKKKKTKTRFYFYAQKNVLWGKCHNCGWAGHFGTFLKDLDSALYNQYVMERFAEGNGGRPTAHAKADSILRQENPTFKKTENEFGLKILSTLPETNEAVQYCMKRKIPKEKWGGLLYLEHTKDIIKMFPQYEKSLSKSEEPRLAIPFESFNEQGGIEISWTGMALRALRGEEMRYINVRSEDTNAPLIFGLSTIDRSQPIFVVEGPLDSLFLPNAIAVAGTSFGKLDELDLPKEQIILVVDNEPRNIEVCKLLHKYIKQNYKVCIWPDNTNGKDINEMVINGQTIETIHQIIHTHTYIGLLAELRFSEWKKC